MAKVLITDTILRDAHQSQAATRMRTEDMLPACEVLDKVGYYSLECWQRVLRAGQRNFSRIFRIFGGVKRAPPRKGMAYALPKRRKARRIFH